VANPVLNRKFVQSSTIEFDNIMAIKLSILTFPQRLENNRLYFNVLVIPRNFNPMLDNPVQALSPAWVNAKVALRANFIKSLADYPTMQLPVYRQQNLSVLPVDPATTDIFNTLSTRFQISKTDKAEAVKPHHFTRKHLPRTYREAFNFTKVRTNRATTDDSYACALKDNEKPNPTFKADDNKVSWGQVFAICLRQPDLAKKCGFIREGFVDIPAGDLTDGGWVYVDLAPGSDYFQAAPANVLFKTYAARIPKINPGIDRNLFAAVLFPVRFDAVMPAPINPEVPSNYDELISEAGVYDDGFAKIVHAHQPVSDHLLREDPDPEFPVSNDGGIRLAWDDEQLLIWLNRQLEEDPSKPGTGQRIDAPMGVMGYRVDVREHSEDENAAWTSLCRVDYKNSLALGNTLISPMGQQTELTVEVHPSTNDGTPDQPLWLPAYFAYWMGRSLVLQDEDAINIYQKDTAKRTDSNINAQKNNLYNPIGANDIALRYGGNYDFRVRLADLTGGGPAATSRRVHDAPSPEKTWLFRRHAIPQTIEIAEPLPQDDTFFTQNKITLRRPRLGYPSVLFTGAYPNAVDLLKADFNAAAAARRDIGLPDPDVDRVEIEVAVRALDMDTTIAKQNPKDQYAILYTTNRAFSGDLNAALEVALTFVDRPVLQFNGQKSLLLLGLSDQDGSIDDRLDLVLPTNRDIQITVRALCAEKADYYTENKPLRGLLSRFVTRRAAANETNFFKATGEMTMIRGLWMRRPPENKVRANRHTVFVGQAADPNQQPSLIEQLAQAIDVQSKGLSLVGKPGQRWQFGASRRIRHTLAPDNTSLTFGTPDDLVNHWIVPITLIIDRDWTWDGIKPTSIDVIRRQKFSRDTDWKETLVGDVELKRSINIQALTKSDRSQTFVCFLDAVEPKATKNGDFPDEILLEYQIKPVFKDENPAVTVDDPVQLSLHLPITTTPAQMPQVVSAGVALSRYQRDADYANTEVRQRYLWVEFDQPVANPNDAYFGRMLAYAPDPLLAEWSSDWMVPPATLPPLPLQPEWVRIISPGHSDDRSGLDAMQQLIPASDSKRHFLVPLPPGLHPESPELFGFFTYEFRIGHREGWSTAQGRFGRELTCQGIQHPTPQLIAQPDRDEKRIRVSAPFADAVFDGRRITAQPVRTQLWALLYAQVRMADDSDNRNILLGDRLMQTVRETLKNAAGAVFFDSDRSDLPKRAQTEWSNGEISNLLKNYGLPAESPLSIICVEMMPNAEHFLMHREMWEQNYGQAQNTNTPAAALNWFKNTELSLKVSQQLAKPIPDEMQPRPLSDDLGYYRLLRTSTLTAVPEVCCVDC
jgi:hypothetical protein